MRDEPWPAKLRNQDLKAELLRMIEWDHRARYGGDFDTRYLGTCLRWWLDDDVQTSGPGRDRRQGAQLPVRRTAGIDIDVGSDVREKSHA